jgi:hypothetical protein
VATKKINKDYYKGIIYSILCQPWSQYVVGVLVQA